MVLILGAGATALVRRDRRRIGGGAESHRIGEAATRGMREAPRRARAYEHFNDASGLGALRDRGTGQPY
ncbi:hypothetical protein ACH429_15630 [Streptomyces pathocidini]|uniref:Uncharacterized protein n=1 Tax=Streptomyces pathocidini TaxID=1650571 RepID=A0ABW7UXR8_9ACTN|nr:hypothetical protein [Streptomyces pathocidini]